MNKDSNSKFSIAIIGLGYVGLPLAVEFGKKYQVIGFDINADRVHSLVQKKDDTLQITEVEIAAATGLSFTESVAAIANCNIYIVTVPTLSLIHI